jgi:lipopolysaccharide biosynthesis glycosyltransferase
MITPVSICVFTDEGFAMHCGAMVASLLSHTSSDVDVHILAEGLSDLSQERLKSLLSLHSGKSRIIFHDVTGIDVSKTPVQNDWPQSIYKRLSIASILPELERVLVLDADMIVLGDIAELWNTDLGDSWVAGVLDGLSVPNSRRLRFKDGAPYLNIGVLLFNLVALRNNHAEEEFWSVLTQGNYDLKYIDQDAFNVVLQDHMTILPARWNSQYISDRYTPRHADHFKHPSIIHYVTKNKPWLPVATVPRRKYYLQYLQKTPWWDEWCQKTRRERWHLAPWIRFVGARLSQVFQFHFRKNKRFVRLFGITLMHDKDYPAQ